MDKSRGDSSNCTEKVTWNGDTKKGHQNVEITTEKENALVKFIVDRKNFFLRNIFGALLILFLTAVLYQGPLALIVVALVIQVICFSEIIGIANGQYNVESPRWFKLISWWLFFTIIYFCYGKIFFNYFLGNIVRSELLNLLVSYHRFLSYLLYMLGIVVFVFSLGGKRDMRLFSLMGCCHVALLLIVGQAYLGIQNCFQGLIWLTVPLIIVFCNDIMAYFCGKLFGKTPLISVSPKKTWEGFVGAAIFTILISIVISHFLSLYPYFTCPPIYDEQSGTYFIDTNCTPYDVFNFKNYTVSLGLFKFHFETCPFVFHSVIFSLFGSIIAPFGGFFASGFKRAFKVKDFGEIIPGHGGLMDRFDCQFLMATFVNVYMSSFILNATAKSLFRKILRLEVEQQIEFYHLLEETLANKIISR